MSPVAPVAGPAPEPPSTPYVGMLAELMTNTLDADYQTVADRRESPSRPSRATTATLVVVVALFGSMLGVSALETARNAPEAAVERADLISHVHARETRLNSLHVELAQLQSQVGDLQSAAGRATSRADALADRLTQVGVSAGTVPVTGPGIEIRANDATTAGSQTGGVILDTDLQELMNALWQSGAEAIAINGLRLTSLSAIRTAGRAITVDFRSLTQPYVIDAIGNPDTLPARLLETDGGQAWLGLKANFGISFDTSVKESLMVPGHLSPRLLYAEPAGGR